MKFSGRMQVLSGRYNVFEACSFLKDAGFDGVEISLEDLYFKLNLNLLDERFIGPIRAHCEEIGLTISAVGNHMGYFFDDFVFDQIQKGIRVAPLYGSDIFIISGMNSIDERVHCKELRSIAVSRIKTLCQVAEEVGVRLALEAEPPSIITSSLDFLALCDEVGSPALGMNLDVGHAFLTDVDVLDSIEKVKDKICHGHIEDMQRGQHLHLLPGDGDMDLPAVLAKLRQVGWQGYMALDLYNYDYAQVAQGALATLRKMDGAGA